MKQFLIPFTGLKLGKHQFEFEIEKNFFDAFEYSLVKDGDIKVTLELDKQETMLILNFRLTGIIQLTCDKCLAGFAQPLDITERQIVKFAEESEDSDDPEIVVLSKKESAIDVSELLYEYITVSVPYINKCEQAGESCDQEMLDTLSRLSAGETKKNEEQKDDPRWAALKKLK